MLPALCAMLFKTYPQSLLLPSRNRLSCAFANKKALTPYEVKAFSIGEFFYYILFLCFFQRYSHTVE